MPATALRSIDLPGAADIDASSIVPHQELVDSNFALDDFATLDRIYQEQGYLLLRDVLDRGSIEHALKRMMAVMATHGIVEDGAVEPIWTGVEFAGGLEESPEFAGICDELVRHPHNLALFEKILGQPAAPVPIVQYRAYAPFTPISVVHQDGFFSPGIEGFRPVWMPLMTIDPTIGGLVLAAGVHKRGLLHNLAKPPQFPIPAECVPEESWATTTYHPGDVLVIHPHVPHVGLANRSDRVRFSIDTRVQYAARPSVVVGDVIGTTPASVTLRTADGDRTLGIGVETYVRTGVNRGARIPLAGFQEATPIGLRVVAAIEGEDALMIRRAAEG